MMRDVYYSGSVPYKGEQYKGRHPAIIDRDIIDRVQIVMDARSQRGTRDRVHYHYLKGMLFCGRCEAQGRRSRLVYAEANGRGGTKYQYFFCADGKTSNATSRTCRSSKSNLLCWGTTSHFSCQGSSG